MKISIQNSFVLLLVIFILFFNLKVIVLPFEFDFFAEDFTEEFTEEFTKNKVKCKCSRKCYFKKIGNESTDQESSIKRLINNEVVFLNSDYSNSFSTSVLIKKNVIFTEKYFFKSDLYNPIEHPPQNLILNLSA